MALAATNPITAQPYSKGYNPGTDSGAITLEWRGNILVATVRPFRNPAGPRHTIEVSSRTGHVRCSCEACKQAIKKSGYPKLTQTAGYCKHIATYWETLAAEVVEHNTPKPEPTKPEPEVEHWLITLARNARSRQELQALRTAVTDLGKAYGLSLNYHELGQGNKTYRAIWNEIGHHVDFFRSTGREPLEPLAVAFLQAIGEVR